MTRTIVLVLALAACAKKTPEPAVTEAPEPEPVEEPAPAEPTPVRQLTENFERVFFALDSAELEQGALDALVDNARILSENPGVMVRIQGHADERGTTEYNLALGQKRAVAIFDALVNMGVAEDQLETVSYGEERPLSDEDGVQAWAMDRRAEFRVLADPRDVVEGTVGQPVDVDETVPESE